MQEFGHQRYVIGAGSGGASSTSKEVGKEEQATVIPDMRKAT